MQRPKKVQDLGDTADLLNNRDTQEFLSLEMRLIAELLMPLDGFRALSLEQKVRENLPELAVDSLQAFLVALLRRRWPHTEIPGGIPGIQGQT